ncbi:putative receptor protein kinase [Planoprotostelium fungivorum]|uniref:Putative receptor protein kinase n=1 Tax=Planoprotostelium fungivorum TaxID=1890364 RepID=A0A2P6NAX7_9EUKA|nr:putative receptor protein kinase [Planoprotostelium fungivorum]
MKRRSQATELESLQSSDSEEHSEAEESHDERGEDSDFDEIPAQGDLPPSGSHSEIFLAPLHRKSTKREAPKKKQTKKTQPKKSPSSKKRKSSSSEEDSEVSPPRASPERKDKGSESDEAPEKSEEEKAEQLTQKKEKEETADTVNTSDGKDVNNPNMAGWSWIQRKVWAERYNNPNQFYYRFNEPGEDNLGGQWAPHEKRAFFKRLAEFGPHSWGLFAQPIYGRVGYQCCSFYRQCVTEGIVAVNGKVDPQLYAQPDETPEEAEGKIVFQPRILQPRSQRISSRPLCRSNEIEWLEQELKSLQSEGLENMGSHWNEEEVEIVIEEKVNQKKPKAIHPQPAENETEYEMMRRKKMEENREQLLKLGLMKDYEEVEEKVVVETKVVKVAKRRSARLTNRAPSTYILMKLTVTFSCFTSFSLVRAPHGVAVFLIWKHQKPDSTADILKEIWNTAGGSPDYYQGSDPCNATDFVGVSCTGSSSFSLSLLGSELNGTVSPAIGLLTNLTQLTISSTFLRGPLPQEISQLSRLSVLDIHDNPRLDGPLSFLPLNGSLTEIRLNNNNFSGPLLRLFLPTNTILLDVSYNNLNGPIPNLSSLTQLRDLTLNSNQFTGEIPLFLFNSSSLQTVIIAYNPFTSWPKSSFVLVNSLHTLMLGGVMLGGIPENILPSLRNLTHLSINGNNITSFPANFSSYLPNLEDINLSNNPMTSMPFLGAMTQLTKLRLTNCTSLQGNLTKIIGISSNLEYLDASNTRITSRTNDIWIHTNLQYLILDNTLLLGDIFPIGLLNRLQSLLLQNCSIQGTIPDSFNALTQLQFLDLSHNNLSGSVPSFLNATTFPSLTSIDLSSNSFSLIDNHALSGFLSMCSIADNSFPCFTAPPDNSTCTVGLQLCPLGQLYSNETTITSRDARGILSTYSSPDQIIGTIAAVVTALLRTTKTFSYTSESTSLSLQTYNQSASRVTRIENEIEGQNCSISLPSSTVTGYDEVSVALSSVVASPFLSIYNESIVIGAQVYDERGREVEIGGETEKINITMGYIDDIPSNQKAVCQWWNETQKGWSRDGCDLYIDEARLAVCQCNHLTNFSVSTIPANNGGMSTKTLIIIICCAAGSSLLILLLSLIIYRATIRGRSIEGMGLSMMVEKEALEYTEKIRDSEESEVWKGMYRGTTAVAVKKMKGMEGKKFEEECQLMKTLHHPHVVQYLGHNVKGSLAEYARGQGLNIESMLSIASDVSKGLSYIGSMGKVHTAVIPSKIVITGHGIVTAKLSSLGCIVDIGAPVREGDKQICMAPEVEREGRWTESGHVWNVGVLLWAMASRRMDVYNSQKRETYTTEGMTDERVAGVIRDSVKERREERVSLSEMTRRMAPEEKKKNWETPRPNQMDGNIYVEQ